MALFLVCSPLAGTGTLMSTVLAQESVEGAVDYSFSTQLGSGVYSVNGRIVQIYRITVSVPITDGEGRAWSLRLRLPTTLGFFDFKFEDIIDTGLSDNIATIAIVPELELELLRRRENWRVMPFVGFGGGKDFQGGEFNYVYAAGVRSVAIWPWGVRNVRLGNRLVYSGYTTKDMDFVNDFGVFETGVDVRRSLGFDVSGREIDWSIFGVNYLFLVSPRLISLNTTYLDFRTEWEFGFTVGTVEPWYLFRIGMPRIGLSYRFDSKRGAVRFVIGNGFPIAASNERSTIVQ